METIFSWFLYAGAACCLFLAVGLAFLGRKSLGVIYGHIGIGAGLAIVCVAGGFLLGGERTLVELLAVLGAIVGGYLIFFFSRRRARDEKRFLDALTAADQKLKSKD